eukprot:6177994-Pleurochrysis_carterae.AAC.1
MHACTCAHHLRSTSLGVSSVPPIGQATSTTQKLTAPLAPLMDWSCRPTTLNRGAQRGGARSPPVEPDCVEGGIEPLCMHACFSVAASDSVHAAAPSLVDPASVSPKSLGYFIDFCWYLPAAPSERASRATPLPDV